MSNNNYKGINYELFGAGGDLLYRKRVLYLFIFIAMIIFTSCSGESEKIKYSAPTISQVNEFISKKSINVLSIKEASDFTIVLYQNDNNYGHYVLHQDQKKQLYNGGVNAVGSSKLSPVSLGGVASGKTPFVTVIINDEKMLQNAKEIQITFKDGTVVKQMISGKGTIVLHHNEENKEPISYTKLVIYDKDMTKLYEN